MKYDKTHDRLIISLGPVTSEGYDKASSKGSYLRGQIIDMLYPYEKKRGRR